MSRAATAHAATVGCPECGGQLTRDDARAETACADCGLVVESDEIDHGPEWRAFDDGEADPRAGTPVDPTRDDNGFMTVIGHTSGNEFRQEGRLRRAAQLHGNGKSKKDRVLARCLSDIKTLCGQIETTQAVSDDACVLFKRFVKSDTHYGIGYDPIIAAAIIAAGRLRGDHVDREGVFRRLDINEQKVWRRLQRFANDIDIGLPVRPAVSYVAPWVDELDGSYATRQRAEEIAREAEAEGLTNSGRKPSGYAAAAVYAAFVGSDVDRYRSQGEIADVGQASEPTLRRNCDELLDAGIISEEERHGR